jgi:site-specific DNA-methyltransferase (adenine-specific)
MDCLEGLKQIDDQSIDLVITDPPYNISNYGNSITMVGNDVVRADFGEWDKWDDIEEYFEWCMRFIKEIERVLKVGGSAYIFFDNPYSGHLSYLIETQTTLRQKCPIVLRKTNPIPHIRKTNFRSSWEASILFVKDPDKKPKTFNFQTQAEMTNVIDYSIGQKETEHPTEKPLGIIELFVKVSSNPDDLVLDCFMGSGTTALACLKLGRKFVGFERDKTFYDMSIKRISGWQIQNKLQRWFE